MAHQAHTPFETAFEDLGDRITRLFKRTGLHILDFGESMGSARAAGELAAIGRHDAARSVMENYIHSSRIRQRLIQQLR